jgi:hypothetical protein
LNFVWNSFESKKLQRFECQSRKMERAETTGKSKKEEVLGTARRGERG